MSVFELVLVEIGMAKWFLLTAIIKLFSIIRHLFINSLPIDDRKFQIMITFSLDKSDKIGINLHQNSTHNLNLANQSDKIGTHDRATYLFNTRSLRK